MPTVSGNSEHEAASVPKTLPAQEEMGTVQVCRRACSVSREETTGVLGGGVTYPAREKWGSEPSPRVGRA